MVEKEFKSAVGLSRKWDAKEAGREVAMDVLNKLGKNVKPDFVLLFPTIHYRDHGGFEKLLEGVWGVLPENTQLIGGTVTGFISHLGCHVRGVTILACSYSNMDVAVGIGKNTRRNPKKAAKECAHQIKNSLENSKYSHAFLFEFISGVKSPKIPGVGQKKVFRSRLLAKVMSMVSDFSLRVLQFGVGREEEVLPELVKELPEFSLIGGSCYDDNSALDNYQFIGDKVYTGSIVALGIKSDLTPSVNTTYGLIDTGRTFKITETRSGGRTIHRINGKPAIDEILKILRWPDHFLDERVHRRSYYTPLVFKKGDVLYPETMGFFMGQDIICGYIFSEQEVGVYYASGQSLIDSVEENLKLVQDKDIQLGFVCSCAIRQEALGAKIFDTQEALVKFFKDRPFLLIYTAGEDTYTPESGYKHINVSFNVATLNRE